MVVSIVGVLAGLTIYTITQAQRQARDAKRKSDVVAINQGFEARFADKTCAQAVYPGSLLARDSAGGKTYPWTKVEDAPTSEECPLKDYLPTLPTDPNNAKYPYIFNLSTKEVGITGDVLAKHFRVAAHLEREPSATEKTECAYQNSLWMDTFGGRTYDCSSNLSKLGSKGLRNYFRAEPALADKYDCAIKCPEDPYGNEDPICKVWHQSNCGTCGDNTCNTGRGETCTSCPGDCGQCSGGGEGDPTSEGTNPTEATDVTPGVGGADEGQYVPGFATRYNYYLGR